MTELSPDLFWLTATAVMTMLMWAPHIVWLILQEGLGPALMDRNHTLEVTPLWAKRAQKAHTNATDNLAAFAILVVVAHLSGVDSAIMGQLAMYYFILRAAHFVVYLFGLPVLRTAIYLASIGVEIVIAMHILG